MNYVNENRWFIEENDGKSFLFDDTYRLIEVKGSEKEKEVLLAVLNELTDLATNEGKRVAKAQEQVLEGVCRDV